MATYQFETGETIRLAASILDEDGAAVEPDTSTDARVTQPDGTQDPANGAMTSTAVGTYYYDFPAASTTQPGTYCCEIISVHGAATTIQPFTFNVIERRA